MLTTRKLVVVAVVSLPAILLLSYVGTWEQIYDLKNLPSVFVAWGTLMLALATYQLVTSSNRHEKTRRADESERYRRDRQERFAREVIEWAADVIACDVEVDSHAIATIITTGIDINAGVRLLTEQQWHRYSPLVAKSPYIDEVAGLHFPGNVYEKLTETLRLLRNHEALLSFPSKGMAIRDNEAEESKKGLDCSAIALISAVINEVYSVD